MKVPPRIQLIALIGCGVSLLAVIAGFLLNGRLPPASDLHPAIREQPQQTEATGTPFKLEREGRPYIIEPVASFEITALVVSRNSLDQETQDKLGLTRDIGVIWGSNTIDNRYHDYDFASSSWSLSIMVPPGVPFSMNEVANIHLVTANDDVADTIDDLEAGAQVRLRGRLINYTRPDLGKFKRRSSLTRDDTGNGACEILLVEQAVVLSNPNAKFAMTTRIGGWGLLLCVILLIGSTLGHVWVQSRNRRPYRA